MNPAPVTQDLRAEASRWWARLDRDDLDEAERVAFEAWRAQNPAHRAAFAEVCALWGELDGLTPRFRVPPGRAVTAAAAPPRRKRGSTGWAVAASLLLALIAIPVLMPRAQYQTGVGEMRTVRLADGSTVYLGSNSALETHFTPDRRHLDLVRGEAWFEVAHDPSRPFVVKAGKGRATALGTVYDVKYVDGRVQVAVVENRVAVDYGEPAAGKPRIVLSAGQQTRFSDGAGPTAVLPVEVDSIAAWRRGRLVFENKPLGEVVAELNRYHHGVILIGDKALRARPVSGVFRTDRTTDALASLENSLGLHSLHLGDYLILLHR